MVIQRFKAIKDLLLDKLDTTLSRIDDLEKIAGFLSENANSSQSKLDSLEQITSQLVKNNTDSQEKLRLLEQLIAEQTFNDNSSLQTCLLDTSDAADDLTILISYRHRNMQTPNIS